VYTRVRVEDSPDSGMGLGRFVSIVGPVRWAPFLRSLLACSLLPLFLLGTKGSTRSREQVIETTIPNETPPVEPPTSRRFPGLGIDLRRFDLPHIIT